MIYIGIGKIIEKVKRLKSSFVFVFSCVLILVLCVLIVNNVIFGNRKEKESVPEKSMEETIKNVSIVMVGDVLIHGSLYKEAKINENEYDFNYMFDEVKNLFNGYDLKFYNQESIIGGKSLGLSTYPRFNSPEEIGEAMVGMGFNLVSLANNHTLDKGENGVVNSLNYWRNKNVITSGSYLNEEDRLKDNIGEVNGIKYALLSYTEHTNGLEAPENKEYLVNIYSKSLVYEDVSRIKNKVDLIIVSIHWGDEYQNIPNKNQKLIASYLSSLGVDIVIGHHPHVIQPIEFINNTLVFYSLGNFLSGQDTYDRLTGLVASLNIKFERKNGVFTKEISSINTDLVYTYHKSFRNYKIIPYTKLDSYLFPKYKEYYKKYYKILTSENDRVIVTNIEE